MLENKFKRRGDAANASGVTLSSVRTSDMEKTETGEFKTPMMRMRIIEQKGAYVMSHAIYGCYSFQPKFLKILGSFRIRRYSNRSRYKTDVRLLFISKFVPTPPA